MHTHTHTHVYKCIHVQIHTHMHIYTYIMSAHIHTYTYIHTRIQNVHMNARKARLKTMAPQRLRGKPSLTPRSSALLPVRCNPEGDTLRGQHPNCCPRETTDKRRATTTNSSSSHHHDSAPSIPHSLICTGAEPFYPVHQEEGVAQRPCNKQQALVCGLGACSAGQHGSCHEHALCCTNRHHDLVRGRCHGQGGLQTF